MYPRPNVLCIVTSAPNVFGLHGQTQHLHLCRAGDPPQVPHLPEGSIWVLHHPMDRPPERGKGGRLAFIIHQDIHHQVHNLTSTDVHLEQQAIEVREGEGHLGITIITIITIINITIITIITITIITIINITIITIITIINITIINITIINCPPPPASSCSSGYELSLSHLLHLDNTIIISDFNAHHHHWHSELAGDTHRNQVAQKVKKN